MVEYKITSSNATRFFPGGTAGTQRGLGTNLYRLGVPEKTIQAILRHANVSTTNTYYIKSAADDTRVAMAKLNSRARPRRHRAIFRR